jgi:hypothetical protein
MANHNNECKNSAKDGPSDQLMKAPLWPWKTCHVSTEGMEEVSFIGRMSDRMSYDIQIVQSSGAFVIRKRKKV